MLLSVISEIIQTATNFAYLLLILAIRGWTEIDSNKRHWLHAIWSLDCACNSSRPLLSPKIDANTKNVRNIIRISNFNYSKNIKVDQVSII